MTEATPIATSSNARLMRLATYASVSVALTLIVAKSAAWLMSDSVSLLSTLVDSLLDGLASMVNLFAVRHALQPADDKFRFGHGKAESLAGLAQSAFISGSAVFLLMEASERLIHPKAVENSEIGMAVMVLSIALTLALVLFQRYVIKKTNSTAISADSLHYQTDLLVNASVIVSLFLATRMGWGIADPLFGIVIALFILWGAWHIASEAFEILMDRELPPDERERIREIALSHGDVTGLHDMKTRSSGTAAFIELHLEMDGEMTLRKSHDIVEEVMDSLWAEFPDASIIIHQDPEDVDERKEFVE